LNFKDKKNFHNYKILVLGILPACIFGYFFSELINRFLSNYLIIGTGFLISSVFLFSSKISAKNQKNKISLKDSFIIGLSQVIALLPGVSRSGVTTSTGILRRISSETFWKIFFYYVYSFGNRGNKFLNLKVFTLIFN
jgi:undecaprenyl-diphosphatase